MSMVIIQLLIIIMLFIPAVSDIRCRSFNVTWPLTIAVVVLAMQVWCGIRNIADTGNTVSLWKSAGEAMFSRLAGMIPGAAFLALSRVSGSGIGAGDGFMLMLLGSLTGLTITLSSCIFSLLMTALTGVILTVCHRGGMKTSLPYIPFIMAGYLITLLITQS